MTYSLSRCFLVSTVVSFVAFPLHTLSAPSFPSFQPCPLLGHIFPPPTHLSSSATIIQALQALQSNFTDGVRTGILASNPITPNTTSFSVALFSSTEDSGDPSNPSSSQPYFFDYHYTSPAHSKSTEGLGTSDVDANTTYRLGSLTQVFTVWAFLINAGEGHWHESVTKYVPELAQAVQERDPSLDLVAHVDWNAVTLGDLAGHLAGIRRDYSNSNTLSFGPQFGLTSLPNNDKLACGTIHQPCSREEFFAGISNAVPVSSSGTTPIFSSAAFTILSYALEALTSKPFPSLLTSSLLKPLDLTSTSLDPSSSSHTLSSTIHDLSLAGRSILSSSLLPPATTSRWLKPISSTSNIANSVGRPWTTIFSNRLYGSSGPIIDIYTHVGSIGPYSSYWGLAPDLGIGFVVLAVDEGEGGKGTGPDLNAHADVIGNVMVPALVGAALQQAEGVYAGVYSGGDARVKIEVPTQAGQLGGLALTEFRFSGERDGLEEIAEVYGIEILERLSVRLYPTGLEAGLGSGRKKVAFRAVVEDKGASADAGTPTCISWQGVGTRTRGGMELDRVEFVVEEREGGEGVAVGVGLPGWGVEGLRREA
ncbi:MAG: hypothetical protein Q9160_006609 [Pyrenula sp. 1 TL-2023]